ncbi:hypothetical protein THAOC_20837, partial [Thalassiosira oceanica]
QRAVSSACELKMNHSQTSLRCRERGMLSRPSSPSPSGLSSRPRWRSPSGGGTSRASGGCRRSSPSEKGDVAAADPAAGVDVVLPDPEGGRIVRPVQGHRRREGAGFVLGGVRRGGLWDYDVDRKEVILVPDRPADADARNVHDVVLRGAVDQGGAAPGDAVLPLPAVKGGSVAVGRCFYPRSHPSFFDGPGPVVRATNVGTFSMAQVLGSLNTGLPSDGDEGEYDGGGNDDGGTTGDEAPGGPAHAAEDLVGRRFVMTVEPLAIRDEKDPDGALAATMPLDLRVLPVEFHQNRTFTARGVNKILRGRYRVYGGSRLEMEVSLFGAGRSAPGSVYRGLSHEDERCYSGRIREAQDGATGARTISVRGSVVFGTDLGTDARPEPVGTFFMMETRGTPEPSSPDQGATKTD